MEEYVRLCRRCTPAELRGAADIAALIPEYVAALPPDDRVPGEVYSARLAACGACPHLFTVTCAHCGCFVQLRAAKRSGRCPDPAGDRWKERQP